MEQSSFMKPIISEDSWVALGEMMEAGKNLTLKAWVHFQFLFSLDWQPRYPPDFFFLPTLLSCWQLAAQKPPSEAQASSASLLHIPQRASEERKPLGLWTWISSSGVSGCGGGVTWRCHRIFCLLMPSPGERTHSVTSVWNPRANCPWRQGWPVGIPLVFNSSFLDKALFDRLWMRTIKFSPFF